MTPLPPGSADRVRQEYRRSRPAVRPAACA